MYYPKSQIKENLQTDGTEYKVQSTGKSYKGYYFQVSNNTRYTGKNPSDKPNNLLSPIDIILETGTNVSPTTTTYWSPGYKFLQKQQGIDVPSAPQSPLQSKPLPNTQDYNTGLFNRYFLYNFTTQKTLEINHITYTQYISQSPSVQIDKYTPVQITWALTGKEKNVSESNYNSIRLVEQNQQLYGFSNYFGKKYNQYYQYNKNENFYSDGKELKYSKDKKPYIGYYHIHPTKGPMVGRQHTMESHDYLEFAQTGSILNPISPTIQSGSYEEPSKTITNTFGGY